MPSAGNGIALGEILLLTSNPQILLSIKRPFQPFKIKRLPLICHLKKIGFYKYKNRWAKRLGKKIGRLIFEVAFRYLKLSGIAEIDVRYNAEWRTFVFESRSLHFSRLYDKQIYDLCEPELAILLESFLTDDMVLYDIGANWGYFSLYASTLPGFNGQIYAFEPIQETFADLQDWVQQLGQEHRVQCHKIALSDTDGNGQMGVISGDSGLASLGRGDDPESMKEQVQISRLESLDLPKPDFIKLDVEGYEYEVIQGSLNIIAASKPMIFFENWNNRQNPEETLSPIRTLLGLGYKLFVPMWWIGPPANEMFWPISNYMFPHGPKQMAYVEFSIDSRFSLRYQINFFCCH